MNYNKFKNLKFSKYMLLILFSIVIITSNINLAENTWKINNIENTNLIGSINYISMKLDSKDNPHICYVDQSIELNKNYSFYYIFKDGTNWNKEIIDINDNVGFYCSIDIDQNDKPHVSYYDELNGNLKYAKKTGETWDIQTIDFQDDVGYHTSIIIDNDNNPHISYYDGTTPYGLKYAYFNITNNWTTKVIDSGYKVGLDTSIGVDSNNNPRISYFDFYHNNKSLRYAYKEDNTWFFSSVDYVGEIGYESSLKIDTNNNPHISYHDTTNNKIKYVYLEDDEWIIQTIDQKSEKTLRLSSLNLDSNNNPHIVYSIVSDKKIIKYAHWTGYKWEIQQIGEGITPLIDTTTKDIPYIVYKETTDKILNEATPTITISSPEGGETWYKNNIYNIYWSTANNNEYIKIELITNNTVYSTIEEKYPNTGVYSWNITEEIKSDQYTIKISNTNNTVSATKTINIKEKNITSELPITTILIISAIILAIFIIVLIIIMRKKK
jgi:hypothetical protein